MTIINLPKIAIGTWSWGVGGFAGGDKVFGANLQERDLLDVFKLSQKLGLNLYDTATVYGNGSSEKILGNLIAENKAKAIISTKFTAQIADYKENCMARMLENSKANLHTDTIDIYWLHNSMDSQMWIKEAITLYKQGKINNIGISNHNFEQIKQIHAILKEAGIKLFAVQNHFSLLYQSKDVQNILAYCKENDIIFFSYMILEQGALTRKYNAAHPFKEGTGRALAYNDKFNEIDKITAQLADIANKKVTSISQVVIAWAIAKGTLPIIGVTNTSQLEDAYKATQLKISAEDIASLDNIARKTTVNLQRDWEEGMN